MKRITIAVLLCAVFMVFVGCGGKAEQAQTAQEESGNESDQTLQFLFPQVVKQDTEVIKGGTLVYGILADTPWKGVFNTFLYEDNPSYEAMLPMLGVFSKIGANRELVPGGYCNMTFDKEAKTATYHINEKLTWSDGVPVTAEDIIFVYECVGHPDYTGSRYSSDYENVVGMVEYHEGKAQDISGLKKIDDKTVEVTFKNFHTGMLWGSGTVTNPEPAHYLKDIPIAKMASHDRIRKTPLACGPFVINSMVEGDILEYVPNPHWFGKKPAIDKLIIKRIAPTSAVAAIKSGEVDVMDLPSYAYDQFVELDDDGKTVLDANGKPKMKVDNIDIIGNIDRSYTYIGFKLGTWNKEKGEAEPFPDGGKFKDKALRQAIGYAIDSDAINSIYFHGLRVTANSFITPFHPGFYEPSRKGYSYNPEKAKKLLDEAGYKDIDGDGYRETPDGKPLKINFLSMTGSDIAEPIANYYIQNWKDVGLHVELNDGRLIEFNAFYDRVMQDDPEVEMYSAGWSVATNPEPSGFYGRNASFNLPRWVDAKNDELLAKIASDEAFDEAFRKKAYDEWDEHILDEAPAIPTSYRMLLTVINKRVKYWDARSVNDWGWEDAAVVSDKPTVNTMK